jgi:hypothetical protein
MARLSDHLDHASWVEDQLGSVSRRSDAPVSADLSQPHSGGREQMSRHIGREREPERMNDGRLVGAIGRQPRAELTTRTGRPAGQGLEAQVEIAATPWLTKSLAEPYACSRALEAHA